METALGLEVGWSTAGWTVRLGTASKHQRYLTWR